MHRHLKCPKRSNQRAEFGPGHRSLIFSLAFAATFSGLTPAPVLALSTDRDQPIHIESDWAEADDRTGVTVYKGKVVIVQGSLRITGDVVTMYFDEKRELERLIAVGRLARFRQKPDGEDVYQQAKAQQIQYNVSVDTMILTGTAQLSKGEDFIKATRIVYDTLNAKIKGESKPGGEPGRVSITIKPKKLCSDGVRRTTCPQ